MIPDLKYYEFLNLLLADQRGKNSLLLSAFEQQFLYSYSMTQRPSLWLTGDLQQGRRSVVDKLWRRYGAEMNFPHPEDCVAEAAQIPPADPTGCEYLVREDGWQRRCNEPATCREPGRLRYCDPHGEAVVRDLKRMGKTMRLVNL